MATLKCKMCGGELEIQENSTVCECEYCGSKQTITAKDDEKILKLYDRANRLRMGNEFDKAAGVYESIIAETDTEAEAYWGLLLCKYGIEYVDDPASGDKIPTCHRSSFDSIMDDSDFDMVMENADALSKTVYREQAKQIEEIRKGIIEISGKEEPYDIFICYKETAEDGDRTIDSVIAQDVYDALTDKGYRVFFSRISLEDKLGTEYEPYIFAALNSAKVMLAFGTNYDYYNAVWVKNEWSRYLKIMAKDKNKYLIPCYKDIDAYDMPKEFAKLQAQDMGKVGAIQDLVRGIEKIIKPVEQETKSSTSEIDINKAIANAMAANSGNNVNALLKRGYDALEDKEWDKADGFFEEVLNQDAENGEAFFGKLLVENECSNAEQLKTKLCGKYVAAIIDEEVLTACNEKTEHINQQLKEKTVPVYLPDSTIKSQYEFDLKYKSVLGERRMQQKAQLLELEKDKLINRCKKYTTGSTKEKLGEILSAVESVLTGRINVAENQDKENKERIIKEYEEFIPLADKKVNEWYESAINKREADYQALVKEYEAADTVDKYFDVQKKLMNMASYKDSEELAKKCNKEATRIKEEEREKERDKVREAEKIRIQEANALLKKKIKKQIVSCVFAVVIVVAIFVYLFVIVPANKYKKAMDLLENGKYTQAYDVFNSLNSYKDSEEYKMFASALKHYEKGNYGKAYSEFEKAKGEDIDKYKAVCENMMKLEENEYNFSEVYNNLMKMKDFDNVDKILEEEEIFLNFKEMEGKWRSDSVGMTLNFVDGRLNIIYDDNSKLGLTIYKTKSYASFSASVDGNNKDIKNCIVLSNNNSLTWQNIGFRKLN